MSEDPETLLFDSLAVIDDELAKNPIPQRKETLEKARQDVNDQLDVLQARQLTNAVIAVKRAADALERVVQSGRTDPLANVLDNLKDFLRTRSA
jgi:hypothetical protein